MTSPGSSRLIEDCLSINCNDLTRQLKPPVHTRQVLPLTMDFRVTALVTLEVDKRGMVELTYPWSTPEEYELVQMKIGLVAHNGRWQRWFFQCPLDVNGKPCRRWAGKLYIARTRWFGCRFCQGLVYRSEVESKAKRLADDPRALKKALAAAKTLTDKKALVEAYMLRRRALEKKIRPGKAE